MIATFLIRSRPGIGAAMLALPLLFAAAGCQNQRADVEMPNPSVQIAEARDLSVQAQAADKAGDADKAIGLYRRAVAAYRDFPPAWNNLGVLLTAKGAHGEAFEAFAIAADLVPSDPRPVASSGMIWQRLGYFDDALKAYDQALERDPNYLPALREAVLIAVQLERITPTTAERVRRAIVRERDPQWLEQLSRFRILIDQRLAASGKESGASFGS